MVLLSVLGEKGWVLDATGCLYRNQMSAMFELY